VSDARDVVIADDHPLFRRGLADVIAAEPGFRIVAELADGEAALAAIRRFAPAVAVLDINMPKATGLDVAEAVKLDALAARIVILTMHDEPDVLRRALDLGVLGYVLKDSAASDIVACLHMVCAGRPWISPQAAGQLMARGGAKTAAGGIDGFEDLTPAERRVLQLVAQDKSTDAIAAELGISSKTVEHHRSHIIGKLGLKGPNALLRFALENRHRVR
jgi:DNA-binding NarL/FixJ family response regulator